MTRAPLLHSILAMAALTSAAFAAPPQDADAALPAVQTYTQKHWGGPCNDRGGDVSAACLRDEHFAALFPNGLVIGDQDGPDGDSEFAVLLKSASAVASFLPKTADPKLLTKDFTDPRPKDDGSGGAFAGQLVAAKLNLAMARAGHLGEGGAAAFADLTFGDGVAKPLRARRFAELVALGDTVISGAYGRRGVMDKRIVDVDGDGTADTTPEAVFDALKNLNNSFGGGRASRQVRGPQPREVVKGPGGVIGGGVGVGGGERGRDADTGADTGRTEGRGEHDDGRGDGGARGDGRPEPSRGRGPVNARGRGKGLEQAREKHGLNEGDAREGDDLATRKLDLRVDLTRTEAAPERARGQLRLRADPEQGRQRLELSVFGLGGGGGYTAFVERTPGTESWVSLGDLTRGKKERNEDDDEDQPAGWHLKLDTKNGDPVPQGLTHISELIGHRVMIRGGDRPVLGALVPPPPPERTDDDRGGMGGGMGGMGGKDKDRGGA